MICARASFDQSRTRPPGRPHKAAAVPGWRPGDGGNPGGWLLRWQLERAPTDIGLTGKSRDSGRPPIGREQLRARRLAYFALSRLVRGGGAKLAASSRAGHVSRRRNRRRGLRANWGPIRARSSPSVRRGIGTGRAPSSAGIRAFARWPTFAAGLGARVFSRMSSSNSTSAWVLARPSTPQAQASGWARAETQRPARRPRGCRQLIEISSPRNSRPPTVANHTHAQTRSWTSRATRALRKRRGNNISQRPRENVLFLICHAALASPRLWFE